MALITSDCAAAGQPLRKCRSLNDLLHENSPNPGR